MQENFTGFVLAGGKSSRMGRDKAFLEFDGETFLRKSFNALAPNCEKICVVLNKSQTHFIEKIPENCEYIFDIYENRGALGGIHCALQNCETIFAVILAVDLPFMTSDAVKNLCEISENSNNFSAVVPRQIDGRLQPTCAVYRVKNCLPKIVEILEIDIDASIRDFLQTVEIKTVEQNLLGKNKNLFENVNSRKDFENLSKIL